MNWMQSSPPRLRSQPEQPTAYACLYGSQDRRDRVLFEFHAFSVIVGISMCFLLLGSDKLRRIYKPLSTVVNVALILQIVSDVLFFVYYPYSETTGNCSEVFVGKMQILAVMFGELHQVYFVANVLGLSRFKFHLSQSWTISLETFLQYATILTALSLLISVFVKGIFMIDHLVWILFVVALQLYFINFARHGPRDEALIDANTDVVNIFQRISWLQIIPTCIALADRVLEMNGLNIYGSLDGVLFILETFSIYLFYVKILVLEEKAAAMKILFVSPQHFSMTSTRLIV